VPPNDLRLGAVATAVPKPLPRIPLLGRPRRHKMDPGAKMRCPLLRARHAGAIESAAATRPA
jgi:hypothetical protein